LGFPCSPLASGRLRQRIRGMESIISVAPFPDMPQHQKEPLHNEEALARQLIATDKVDLKGMN
jgi:hypothetical protein